MTNEHGSYNLQVLPKNILVINGKGPWNTELIKRFHCEVVDLVDSFAGKPWHHIVILEGETLFTPEVTEFIKKHYFWNEEHNLLTSTVILSSSLSASASKWKIKAIHDFLGGTVRFVDSLEEALKRLT